MENADMPAMPISEEETDRMEAGVKIFTGLTKREMMAMAAMQGLCAHSGDYYLFAELASDAVNYADALLAELERTKGESK